MPCRGPYSTVWTPPACRLGGPPPCGRRRSVPDGVNPSAPDGGGVIILEPGDEKAQKIAKAIASRTAGEILQLLKDGSHASTQIAESLKIPITTVQYHLENLVEAGIITVVEKRW